MFVGEANFESRETFYYLRARATLIERRRRSINFLASQCSSSGSRRRSVKSSARVTSNIFNQPPDWPRASEQAHRLESRKRRTQTVFGQSALSNLLATGATLNTNLSGSFHVHLHERADSRARTPAAAGGKYSPSRSPGWRLPTAPASEAAATSARTARARYDDPRGANWFILGSHLIGQRTLSAAQ